MRASDMRFGLLLIVLILAFQRAIFAQTGVGEWPPEPPRLSVERLDSGLRVIYLPGVARDVGSGAGVPALVEIAFGYAANRQPASDSASEELVKSWLVHGVPARSVELIAHLSGGRFENIDDVGLIGLRASVPEPMVGAVMEQVVEFFSGEPGEGELLDYIVELESARVEASTHMRAALDGVARTLMETSGDRAADVREPGASSPDSRALSEYFETEFGTDRAWVIVSTPLAQLHLEWLDTLQLRPSSPDPGPADPFLFHGQSELTLPSRSEGGLVIGSRVSSVHYEGWFNTLVVDRALRRVLDPRTRLVFGPSRWDAVHVIERAVALPEYARDVAGSILSRVGVLQGDVTPMLLAQVKQDGLAYLTQRPVLEWFAAHGLWQPLEVGWSRVWNLTEEEFRASVGAFLAESRLTSVWDAAYEAPAIVIEGLGTELQDAAPSEAVRVAPGQIRVPALGDLPVVARRPVRVERLPSGVTLASGEPAVFVAGSFDGVLPGAERVAGPNGTLWKFPELPDSGVLGGLSDVRPERLLFFLPTREHARWRELLTDWESGISDATDSTGVGSVASGDLAGLVILKVWLDRKVIEAGWSGEVEIGIVGVEGADLVIRSDELRRVEVGRWLEGARAAFGDELGEREFSDLLFAAGAYFDEIRTDLEILLWQRAPDGQVPPPDTVSFRSFRNILEVYF